MSKFNAAQNLDLETDADFDQYIDASVTGADRILARRLMRMMAPNQRGDFVYYDGSRVISNNADLVPRALDFQGIIARLQSSSERPAASAIVHSIASDVKAPAIAGSCSPPDPYGGTGPYARMVSNCGFSGQFSVVNLPCSVTTLYNSDFGYLYSELRDQAGNLFEGGIFDPQNDSSLNPYVSKSTGLTLTNASARYACGSDLFIGTGVIPTGGTPMYMALLGIASNWSASLAFQPSYSLTITSAAYVFQNDSKITATSGNDPDGVATACTGCSITKVTSIAQPQGSENLTDGSVFGIDPLLGAPSIFWEDIRFGEWQAGSNSSSSTLVYSTNSSSWYAGEENYPNQDVAYAEVDPTGVAFQSYDGVSLVSGDQVDSHKRAASAYNVPAAPTCTLDKYGYCLATSQSKLATNVRLECDGQNSFKVEQTVDQILNAKKVLAPFTEYQTLDCPDPTIEWLPNSPAAEYKDPNLPS